MDFALSEEVKEQLSLFDHSQKLLLPIFLGLLLQYKAIDVQRTELLATTLPFGTCCTDGCPAPKTMQLTSSLLILSSLLGFQTQAEDINAQAAASGECPDETDVTLGMIVILVAMLRFLRLLDSGEGTPADTAEQEDIEDTEVIL